MTRTIVAILTVLLVGACAAPQAAPASPSASATPFEVVVALAGEPSTLDQQQRLGAVDGIAAAPNYDSLLFEGVDGKIGPGLAESYQFAADGLSVTLKLRQGVKFHDGTPFNADAVKFNFERQLDKASDAYKDGKWALADLFLSNIKIPVVAVDASTVRIDFKEQLATDVNIQALSGPGSQIVSPTAAKASRSDYGAHPVGTGPFRFVSWEKGQRIVYERNPDYWGPKPQLDKLILVPIADPDARAAALRSGTVDINSDISGTQLEAVKTLPGFTVAANNARHVWMVLFNQKVVPQFKDPRVRQAFNYAVDKDAIVKDILRGTVVASKGPVSPAFGDYFDSSLPGFGYDLNKAKQLLAAAGFPGGQGLPALAMLVPTNPALAGNPIPMSEAIQANLGALGVKVTLQSMDFATWRTVAPKAEFQMTVFSQNSAVGDPDNVLYQAYHSSRLAPQLNYGSYKNDEFDRISLQSRSVLDRTQRIQLIKRQQQIVGFEDPAAIWIEHGQLTAAFNSKKVKAMKMSTYAHYLPFNLIERP